MVMVMLMDDGDDVRSGSWQRVALQLTGGLLASMHHVASKPLAASTWPWWGWCMKRWQVARNDHARDVTVKSL